MNGWQFSIFLGIMISAVVAAIAHEFTATAVLMGFSGLMLFLGEDKRC